MPGGMPPSTEPRPSREDFCRGELCTLCGAPAWAKISEEPFDSSEERFLRHPLTAYVCRLDFQAIFRSYFAVVLKDADESDLRRRLALALPAMRAALFVLSQLRSNLASADPFDGLTDAVLASEVRLLAGAIERVDPPLTERS